MMNFNYSKNLKDLILNKSPSMISNIITQKLLNSLDARFGSTDIFNSNLSKEILRELFPFDLTYNKEILR